MIPMEEVTSTKREIVLLIQTREATVEEMRGERIADLIDEENS